MDTVHDVTEAVLGLEIHFGLPSGLQGSSSFRHRAPRHCSLVGKGTKTGIKAAPSTQCPSTSPLPQKKPRESLALCRCGRRKRGRATPTDRLACARRRDTLDQWGSTEVMQHRNSKQSRLAPPLVETAGVKPESAEARGLGHFAAGPQGDPAFRAPCRYEHEISGHESV